MHFESGPRNRDLAQRNWIRDTMRTTLDIDDEVLTAAKEIARRHRTTAGAVISELARRALTQPGPEPFFGFRPLAARRDRRQTGGCGRDAMARVLARRPELARIGMRGLAPCARIASVDRCLLIGAGCAPGWAAGHL